MSELWPVKEAKKLLQRGAKSGDCYIFETGFGPSGFPHMGTFGEAVRTYFVMLTVEDLGYPTKCIAFSDDLDGLRKVPAGFPSEVSQYLGMPVSLIPDPFKCCESYSAHINILYQEILDKVGMPYVFKSSKVEYQSGVFNETISTIIRNYEKIKDIILPTLSESTRENWFPFLPICVNCGKINTTRVIDVDKAKLEVEYICDRVLKEVTGCGFKGQCSVLNGTGKMQWKVDWATRWHAYQVDYELYGKDLIDSAKIGKRIIREVLQGREPLGFFFELFLDEDGSKISKSKGKGLSLDDWLKYGTEESLRLLLFDKPTRAKRLTPDVIPHYLREVDKAAEEFYVRQSADNDEKRAGGRTVYEYITFFSPPEQKPIALDFGALCNLINALRIDDISIIKGYITRIPEETIDKDGKDAEKLIRKALNYCQDFAEYGYEEPELTSSDVIPLEELCDFLKEEHSGEEIHNEIYSIARRNNGEPKRLFKVLYQILINRGRGPQMGKFIKLLGQEMVIEKIQTALSNASTALKLASESKVSTQPRVSDSVSISPEVGEAFQDFSVGVLIINGIKVESHDERLANIRDSILKEVKEKLGESKITELPTINEYKRMFRQFGVSPTKRRPSPEALLRRFFKNDEFPTVNTVVDTANLLVLKNLLSMGVYDLDKMTLPVELRFAKDSDRFQPIGSDSFEELVHGELVYSDQKQIICRDLNYKDANSTKVTLRTKNLLVLIDGCSGANISTLQSALDETCSLITELAGGSLKEKGIVSAH